MSDDGDHADGDHADGDGEIEGDDERDESDDEQDESDVESDGRGAASGDGGGGAWSQGARSPKEPPPSEGENTIIRPPGQLAAPYPPVEIIITVGLEHLTAALAHEEAPEKARPPEEWRRPRGLPGVGLPGDGLPGDGLPGEGLPREGLPGEGLLAAALRKRGGRPRTQHALPATTAGAGRGTLDHGTLTVLACAPALRRALLDPAGAVIDLGRTTRLATAAQKRALLARDIGCVIPGCPAPGADCDVHHVEPWSHGGASVLQNLVLACPRHHSDIHHPGGWTIQMVEGVPWVEVPPWIDRTRPLLRNTTFREPTGGST
jgi:hypothetical protein